MRNLTPEELALLVVPHGGNRYAPQPGSFRPLEEPFWVIQPCGVLAVALDEDAAAGQHCPPHASWLVCRLRDGEGVEWWCRADFLFTTHADALEYLQAASPAQLSELAEQIALEDI